jgi:hypothetical protein
VFVAEVKPGVRSTLEDTLVDTAELLSEDMPPADFRHFLNNILSQNARQKQLIDSCWRWCA